MKLSNHAARCALLAAMSAISVQTHADTAPSAVLEEVTVTAQKRSESVQKVPMSITTFSDAQIERSGFVGVTDYASRVPNLALSYGGDSMSANAQTVTLRGIYGNGTTGMYLDETPLPDSVNPRVVDLQRIEVLRGPQGSLYGARSMGGVVRLITKRPEVGSTSAQVHSALSTTREGGFNRSLDGTFNLPLVEDTAALRAYGFAEYQSGFLDRVASPDSPEPFPTHRDVNSQTSQGGELAVSFDLLDNALTITPRVLLERTSVDSSSYTDARPDNFVLVRPFDIDEPGRDAWELYTLTAKYTLPFGEITSATSQFDRRARDAADFSEMATVFLGIPPYECSIIAAKQETSAFSQELRLASSFSGPLQLTTGLFYQRRTAEETFPPLQVGDAIDDAFHLASWTRVTELAAFGEFRYEATDRLALIAGARAFRNEVEIDRSQGGLVVLPTNFSGAQKEQGLNPKFSLQYQLSDDVNLFATASKGFRIGGVNSAPLDFCARDLQALGLSDDDVRSYKSDSLWSYEIGAKTRWLDQRLSVNATAFHIDWSDVQQTLGLPCAFSVTVNAGEARSDGFELEVEARPAPGLSTSVGVGYTDARVTSGGQLQTIHSGTPVQQVPDWNVTLGASYDFTIGSLPMFAQADYAYVGSSLSTVNSATNPRSREPYSLTNGRIGAEIGPVELALFVQNIFDEMVNYTDTFSLGIELPDRPRIATNRPRTVGIDLRARF